MNSAEHAAILGRVDSICRRIVEQRLEAGSYVSAWCSMTILGTQRLVPNEALPQIQALLSEATK